MQKSKDADKEEKERGDAIRVATALSASEVVARFGSASAEYLKGYHGVDNETGQKMRDGLKSVSLQKTGLAQKAGNSAEIFATSRHNAENIISKSSARSVRADDLSKQFGTNHPVADLMSVGQDGKVTFAQMKFEASPNKVINKIVSQDGAYSKYLNPLEVCEARAAKHLKSVDRAEAKAMSYEVAGKGELAAKYREISEDLKERVAMNQEIATSEIRLEVPSDQLEDFKRGCREKAKALRGRARELDAEALAKEQLGDTKASEALNGKATNFRETADRCDTLEERVVDSGVTREEALLAARKPVHITAKAILKTSHRAGLEGAKYGAVIAGVISVLSNSASFSQNEQGLSETVQNIAADTLQGAALGYGTAFAGSAIKGVLQQASNAPMRSMAATTAPALMVSICLSLGSSVKRYVTGEISEAQLMSEVGEKGAGMLAASMMSVLGQVAIPIPFIGAAIGGMIGYTLSSFFYQSALDAAQGVELSRHQLQRVKAIEAAARDRIAEEQAMLDAFTNRELPQLKLETAQFLAVVHSAGGGSINVFATALNEYATLLGKTLQFQSIDQFDDFMRSDTSLSF